MLRATLYFLQAHLELSIKQRSRTVEIRSIESCGKYVSVASYRSKRPQLVEEVPGLYIRRLTLEDPKIARERPDSGLQLPARHVCHPRASYVPSDRPTSSYRSWLERLRRERPAVLTVTSLELPDCPVPLIDSLASNRWRTANSRNVEKDDTLNELFAKVAEARARNIESWQFKGLAVQQIHENNVQQQYEVKRHSEQIANDQVSSLETARARTVDRTNGRTDHRADGSGNMDADQNGNGNGNKDEDEVDAEHEKANLVDADECTCNEVSEKLRINIRKKTEVKRSSRSHSPEVTHTISIAMKCHGQREQPARKHKRRLDPEPTSPNIAELQRLVPSASLPPTSCPGFNLTLDFSLNCSGLQLISRNFSVRPIIATDIDQN